MPTPDISIVVTTYQRPANLRRVLASIAGQQGVDGRFEVVVADDGSTDETPKVVREFKNSVCFPVRFTTHAHQGFCPSRARNEGVAASRGEYVLMLDGDCMLPRNHLAVQLAKRQPGVVRVGDSIRLAERPSARVSEEFARRGRFTRLASLAEHARIVLRATKSTFYNLRNHPDRPRLIANCVALWKRDYERVNGFDQSYVGWGAEDDDLGFRLRRAGLELKSILWWTTCYHLWHPKVPSAPEGRTGGSNYQYLRRGFHLIRCCNGLTKRTWREISFSAAGPLPASSGLRLVFPAMRPRFVEDEPTEVEMLFTPGPGSFTGKAQCNILVAFDQSAESLLATPDAHLVLCDEPLPGVPAERQFRLHEWEAAMNYLMFNSTPTEQTQAEHVRLAA